MRVKIVLMLLVLLFSINGMVVAAAEESHWVDNELKDYKQLLVLAKDSSTAQGPVTTEEWKSFHDNVLNAAKFNEPIEIYHWATGLKMALDMPKEKIDTLLQMYVYGLAESYPKGIRREDAVGGLVKLLTISHLKGSWSGEELKPAEAIKDVDMISGRQKVLVQIAYIEGILDTNTKETFRPQDKLTHAEAISMLYKVMKKYDSKHDSLKWSTTHWSTKELKSFYERGTSPKPLLAWMDLHLQSEARLGQSIAIADWHELLMVALGKSDVSKPSQDTNYTYGLAQGQTISRDRAVAGIMKLWGESRDATQAEKDAVANRFADYAKAFDLSKLALANQVGLIEGYDGGLFGSGRDLTYAEAAVLAMRIVEKNNANN
jgi:hypothetical protein